MNLDKAARIAYFLLRVVAGLMFFQAGAMIMLGWFGGMPGGNGGAPDFSTQTQTWIGGLLELVGGFLVMVGLFTRPAAFLVSGEMAVAYWQFHYLKKGGWPLQNDGTPAVLFCFIFLLIAAQGGGSWSLDALFRKRRAT
jgi:putative oxidoreductase